MQVGPGFIDSIRRHGLVLNILAASIVLMGVIVTLCIYFFTDLRNNVPVLIGMLCGAVTNTPSLGAANSALAATGMDTSLTGIGYAVAYPFGVIGIILVMILVRIVFRQNPAKASDDYAKEIAATRSEIVSASLLVENKNLFGVPIKEIPDLISSGVVITRLLRGENIFTPNGKTVIEEGDKVHIVGMPEAVRTMEKVIGSKLTAPITKIASKLETRSILVTSKKMLGKTIGSLGFERYGVTVSRVVRGEFKFTGRLDLRLKFADKLLVVGPTEGIDAVAKELGDSLKALEHPEILPAFLGIFIGVIVGSIPIAIPGMPTAQAWTCRRTVSHRDSSFAQAENRSLELFHGGKREPDAPGTRHYAVSHVRRTQRGIRFFDVLLNGDGFYYMGLAALITFIPLMIAGIVGKLVFKINYLSLCGMIAGSMTDPPRSLSRTDYPLPKRQMSRMRPSIRSRCSFAS